MKTKMSIALGLALCILFAATCLYAGKPGSRGFAC